MKTQLDTTPTPRSHTHTLTIIMALALLLAGCASAPPPVLVVPGEPAATAEPGVWAEACVYGPPRSHVPPGARSLMSLSEGQRAALADIEALARRTYRADAAAYRRALKRFNEHLRGLPPARLQDYRKAAQWRADIIERRVPYKRHLRQQSPCYGLLLDVYHRAGSALDWQQREASRPRPRPRPTATGVTVQALQMTPIEGGWSLTLDRGKIHGVEAGDWAWVSYQGQRGLLVVQRVQARRAVATLSPRLPRSALRVAWSLFAGPAPAPPRAHAIPAR